MATTRPAPEAEGLEVGQAEPAYRLRTPFMLFLSSCVKSMNSFTPTCVIGEAAGLGDHGRRIIIKQFDKHSR